MSKKGNKSRSKMRQEAAQKVAQTNANPDLSVLRDQKCIALAREVLQVVAECAKTSPMGEAKEETRVSFENGYKDATEKVLTLFLDADLQLKDIEHVKQLVKQPCDWILNMASSSVAKSVQKMEVSVFGRTVPELGFKQIDQLLIAAAQRNLKNLASESK